MLSLASKKHGGMYLPILNAVTTSTEGFITFWDRLYSGYDEEFYQQNIGKPLTPERIREWFAWLRMDKALMAANTHVMMCSASRVAVLHEVKLQRRSRT